MCRPTDWSHGHGDIDPMQAGSDGQKLTKKLITNSLINLF